MADSISLKQDRLGDDEKPSLAKWIDPYVPTIKYVLKRIGIYLITVWGAITVSFIFFHIMPGDPIRMVFDQLKMKNFGEVVGGEDVGDAYRELFGLDKPLAVQYVYFLRNVLVRGFDLGPSFIAFPKPARELILSQLPWTLGYFTLSMLIAWGIGTALGAILGWLRRTGFSSVAVVIATFIQTIPVYIIAIIAIIVIAYQMKWLPAGQPYDPGLMEDWSDINFIKNVLRHAIMPVTSMVLVWGASYTLGMRALMISVLGEDYLAYARAKGLKPSTILGHYAFRNALLPQVTTLGIALGSTLNGALIIEALFLLPGLGGLFIRAQGIRDFNVMQGIVLISTVAILTLSLIVDLTLPFLDPRIRSSNA